MGRLRKRHNWKARQQVETKVDHSEQEKIKVDLKDVHEDEFDESNALVLPAKKRKTKVKDTEEVKVKQRLSKKQRKHLEKIVQAKEKKAKRASLLESLQSVQASKEEMAMMTSVSEMHSGKYKRQLEIEQSPSGQIKVNAISGSKKRRPLVADVNPDSSSSSSSSSSEDSETSEEESDDSGCDAEEEGDAVIGTSSKKEVGEKRVNLPESSQASGAMTTTTTTKSEGKASQQKLSEGRVSAVHVPVTRPAHIQEQRLRLPILAEEQGVMEVISENPVVIICGETGSGKTTQVPQFLYEAGYAHGSGIIGVTEPRRVAAVSMSKRVAQEMSLSASEVSYQIRYEGNVTPDTKIKFMTDGVLMKEVQKDFLLSKYSVIIIDEAHERSMYTDIMIGLLSRIVPLREKKGKPLKLIIMSATLRVEDFTENKRLFPVTPPVVKVDSRQYPVTIHFNKRTPVSDYLGEAYKKVCKIHRQLPEGGILVFVTGQQEVHTLCAKLKRSFPFHNSEKTEDSEGDEEREELSQTKSKLPPKVNLDQYSSMPLDEEEALQHMDDQSDGEMSDGAALDDDDMEGVSVSKLQQQEQPLHVLPLYSLLATQKQAKVFEPPPEGSRLCVVATNVAETSLTIPGIKYVVDTGKTKTRFYDKVTGVSAFKVTWASQASANQRAGRAGRTGPGHSYRLYSSAVFSDFEKFSQPEITRRPVDDLVLQMKDMSIDKVVNFPFPTPPDAEALKAAEKLLVSLGALEKPPLPKSYKEAKKGDISTKVTPLGKAMACFPVSPRYGKMLSLGHQHDLLPYVVAIVAALSVQELLVGTVAPSSSEQDMEDQKQKRLRLAQMRRTWAGQGQSALLADLMVLLKAVGACEYAGGSQTFCEQHGIRYKAMVEVRKLRAQLTRVVNAVISDANLVLDPKMEPPNDVQARLLRQIVLAGLGDHIARKMADPPVGTEDAKKYRHAYKSMLLEEPVFIHPGSVLYRQNVEYVVYQHVEETSKLYMKGLSAIEPEWLPLYVANRCTFSKPLDDPPPHYGQVKGQVMCHMTSTFGPHCWQLPAVETEYPEGLDRYKLFSRFLLEGKVCPKLSKFTSAMLSAPVTMVKPWAKLQPRTETLLKTLVSKSVDNRDRLQQVWAKTPIYLFDAYCEWLPQSLHEDLKAVWPPL